MSRQEEWVTVKIPMSLAKAVDDYLSRGQLGSIYRSRSELIRHIVKEWLSRKGER